MQEKCPFNTNCKKYDTNICDTDAYDFCIRRFKLSQLYKSTLIPEVQWKKLALSPDVDGTDRDKFEKLKQIEININSFVEGGKNLYLHSKNCGNGKTAWSIRMIQAYINSIWAKSSITCRALFINVPKFLLALKDNISVHNDYVEYIKNNVNEADLVVWDEIGIKTATTFEMENLLNIINNRLDNGKSNIYTSNIDPIELKEKLGDRLYSRVVNMSEDIELFGKDKRGLN